MAIMKLCGCGATYPQQPGQTKCSDCRATTPKRVKAANNYTSALYHRNRSVILSTATHCSLCGRTPTPDNPLTADHIIPKALGGSDELQNLRATHYRCNASRGDGTSKSNKRNDLGRA